MQYNWQHPEWPNFKYDILKIQDVLYTYIKESSTLLGGLSQFSEEVQSDALVDLMVSEALKTSEIEGEKFNYNDVRSSLMKELGIYSPSKVHYDPRTSGLAQLMVLMRKTYKEPLSKEHLFKWQELIFLGDNNHKHKEVGKWRSGSEPMQIVSGAIGHEQVHFEAPPSEKVDFEMTQFINWFNVTSPSPNKVNLPGPIRAAISHIYFESIHPFADGNGRIGRAISEKALSQDLGGPSLLSLSTIISKNKKKYYAELSYASRYDIDITAWIKYFVDVIYQAQLDSKQHILFVLNKAKFWHQYRHNLNERQQKVVERMFQAGSKGFKGGMSAQKYMKLTNCSKATATRDLSDLLQQGCFIRLPGSGRSTRYDINFSNCF